MTANVDNDSVVDATKGNECYTFQHNWNHTMFMHHVAAERSFRRTFLCPPFVLFVRIDRHLWFMCTFYVFSMSNAYATVKTDVYCARCCVDFALRTYWENEQRLLCVLNKPMELDCKSTLQNAIRFVMKRCLSYEKFLASDCLMIRT